jgi:NitT/TauT family transport system ATP-binding protein
METTPAVALKEVTFSFAERLPLLGRKDPQPHQVLGPLNDATREGQITAILGPSGCGKSTLLRLIAGLLQPVSGSIERVADADHMAFIFQDPTLLPWATVTENIALPLRLKGYSREQREATACLWAERVGLHDALDRRPAELSGGMRMRVSLARGLSLQPRLVLFDEPFGALDTLTRNRLNDDLIALHSLDQWTAFFVTHSVSEAAFLAHRILLLSPRPALIQSVECPALPFPRVPEIRQSLEFQSVVADLTARIQSVITEHEAPS